MSPYPAFTHVCKRLQHNLINHVTTSRAISIASIRRLEEQRGEEIKETTHHTSYEESHRGEQYSPTAAQLNREVVLTNANSVN